MKFDSYHPIINLIYFTAVILCSIFFRHPVFLAVSYICAFIYSVKLNGKRAVIFNICLIPFVAVFAAWYAYYNHFGITYISQNFTGNNITLEALIYGFVLGVVIAAVFMWLSCVYAIMSTDKIVYLFGRISPTLSLFVSVILRTVPRIKARAKKINLAQQAIGRGFNRGNPVERCANFFRQVSMIITWTIENFTEVSDSMRCRGYGLKGRTAYSIYRFDNRDRIFVVSLFWCLIALMTAVLFGQVNIQYNPVIIMNRITSLSAGFYAAYGIFCILPMSLQVCGEMKFRRLIKNK